MFNQFIKRGSILSLALMALTGAASGYAGNVYISKDISATAYLTVNSSPVSSNTTTLKSADELPADSYKKVDPVTLGDGTTWLKFNIIDTSYSKVYILLVSGNTYLVKGPFDLGTTKPTDSYIKSSDVSAYYTAATPPAATVTLTLEGITYPAYNGIISSSIGAISAGYEKTGTKYALYIVTGGTDAKDDGALSDQPVKEGGGALSSYTADKGRIYRAKMAYVNAFTSGNENWGWSSNLLIPETPAAFTLAFKSKVSSGKPGINSFSLPFAGPWYAYKADGTTGLYEGKKIESAYDLIKAINEAAGDKIVSSCGKWDNSEQKISGFMLSAKDPDAEDVKTKLQAATLVQGEGYQIYVTKDVVLVIKGAK
jgi:hypothetical protein